MVSRESEDAIILETALGAARAAGTLLAQQFGRPQSSSSKPDASIVSEADILSERAIRELVRARFPDHSFLGEEDGRVDRNSRFEWIVDPLDGTKNFLRGVPLFAVEIAVLRDGLPYIGVSYLPMMDELLWAVRGGGAHSNGGQLRVSTTCDMGASYVSFGNVNHFDRASRLHGLLCLVRLASQSRGIGDAWSFHLLARGSIDIFVDARTALWDIAALTVIVEEAGGTVTDLQGQPITSQSTSVVATNSFLHPAVLLQLRRDD